MAEHGADEVDSEYIFRIVHLGDSREFREILERHPTLDLNIQNEDGESLLIHCIKRLGTKWTALIGGEFRAIYKTLIERNIDIDLTDAAGKSAANYATELQQLTVLRLLIEKGAYIDTTVLDSVIDKEDWIPAICASLSQETAANSSQVHSGDNVQLKLFHRLLSSDYLSNIRWMCDLFPGIIEEKNEHFLTALHTAVIENNVDALKILLEFKTNVDVVDNNGHTALHFAVDYGHTECMRSLLESGAKVNCQDSSGSTPLHYAINAGSSDQENKGANDVMVEDLIKFGADTTLADGNGRLPLHWTANAGNATFCAQMIEHGSPVNARCNNGLTALHIAASQGHIECIEVLVINCRADINIEDNYGYTPLFNAITARKFHCAEFLLYHDASPNHCNKQGNSPAHLAASKGLTEALERLVKYKGSVELRNNSGYLPLHEAVLFQHLDSVNYLLKCHCDVNVRNNQGFTPLHLATSVGSIAVCEILLQAEAAVNCITTQCKNDIYKFLTALDMAHLNKHSECAEYLQKNGGACGDHVVVFASRKIQSWWKQHRQRKRTLESIKEYSDVCVEATDMEPVLHEKHDDEKLQKVEKTPHENTTRAVNAQSERKGTIRMASVNSNELGTRSGKNAGTKTQTAKKTCRENEKSRTKSTLGQKTATTTTDKHVSLVRKPARSNERKEFTNKTTSGEMPSECRSKASSTVNLQETETIDEKPRAGETIKERLEQSLQMEIARKEKISKDIACLKKNLEKRSEKLEKRLGVIERQLQKL